jgi:acetyltransferase-like isoleucine patch superfamily enzyme
MGLVNRILNRLRYEQSRRISPVMVSGYTRFDGKRLPLTRISNTTFIDTSAKLDIANNVFIGHHNFLDASNGLAIEEGCQLTNFISVLTHSSHISIRLYGSAYGDHKNKVGYATGSVRIGAYTFVGPHSVIMPGATLGKGCLVSAFSYVKGAFPDFSIVAGNPAVRIGDTRDLDRTYLQQHPELQAHYDAWAK